MAKGRTRLVGVKVTPLEDDALNWRVGQLRAAGREASRSTLIYEMAQRGSLRGLVDAFVESQSSHVANGTSTEDGDAS